MTVTTKQAEVAIETPEVEVDEIIETAKTLETLDASSAMALIPKLLDNRDQSNFKLGGVLSVVQSNNWWKDEGYENFRKFIEGKFGIQYRKAMYLITIYNSLVDAGLHWDQVKDLGWSKLKELAGVLTKENVAEWVAKCKDLTVLQIQEEIRKYSHEKLETSGSDAPEDAKATVSTFTVKVFPDQKTTIAQAVDKAKKDAGTDSAGVALEAIAMNYLSGGKTNAKKAPTLAELMKKSDAEAVLNVFAEVFPNVNVEVTM